VARASASSGPCSDSLGPCPHLPPRLHKSLDGAGRRTLIDGPPWNHHLKPSSTRKARTKTMTSEIKLACKLIHPPAMISGRGPASPSTPAQESGRRVIAFELALEIGASTGIHHGGDAHHGKLPPQLSRQDFREPVLHATSLSIVRLVLARAHNRAISARGFTKG
jgi:hypothetical protein